MPRKPPREGARKIENPNWKSLYVPAQVEKRCDIAEKLLEQLQVAAELYESADHPGKL